METNAVLITGANGGLGTAFVDEFSKNGWDIIAHARVENTEFSKKIESISKKYNNKIIPVFFDMCDSVAMKDEISKLIKAKIPINTLVNNAGVGYRALFNMTKIETVREVFNINFFAQLELTQLLLKYLAKHENPSVINISSIASINLSIGEMSYATSKVALNAFTQILAAEYKFHKVRINAITPGLINNGISESVLSKEAFDKTIEMSAMKRMAQASEIAKVAVFLASDNASYVNGEIIKVDGGKYI